MLTEQDESVRLPRSDLITVDADPLADVSALQGVVFVMKGGTVFKSP